MTQKSDMSGFIFQPRMILMIHCPIIPWACNIAINNSGPIKNDFYLSSLYNYLLRIPISNRFKITRFGRNYTINRTMVLVWLQVCINRCRIIEDLKFHSHVSGIAGEWSPYSQTIICRRGEKKFKTENKV